MDRFKSNYNNLKIRFVTNNVSLRVNYMPTTRQWEILNSMFGTPVDCFFPNFKGSKHGSSYQG